MRTPKPLGKYQLGCLQALRDNGHFPGGWHYGGQARTYRIMETLFKRGLLNREEQARKPNNDPSFRYSINESGLAALLASEGK